MESTHLAPGTILHHNTYRIEKILGQGGFGITYMAKDLNLDRTVAIKEFFPKEYCDRDSTNSKVTVGSSGSKGLVERMKSKFLKEARNIARFDFPGIIRIYNCFEENDTAYYVMEYIEGNSLSDIVKARGPLDKLTALRYIDKVGKALEYLHEHRFNHLDVKPANIMLRSNDDQPILIDFGLSKQYDTDGHQTSTTPVGISRGFTPLEQYNTGGVSEFSPRADLYSLAATLYYLLTGVIPTEATQMHNDGLTFPTRFPAELISPIKKAMSIGYRDRHETVAQFLNELKGAKNSESTVIMTPTTERTVMNSSSRPTNSQKKVYHAKTEGKDSKRSKKIWVPIGIFIFIFVVILIILLTNNDKNTIPNNDTSVKENTENTEQTSSSDETIPSLKKTSNDYAQELFHLEYSKLEAKNADAINDVELYQDQINNLVGEIQEINSNNIGFEREIKRIYNELMEDELKIAIQYLDNNTVWTKDGMDKNYYLLGLYETLNTYHNHSPYEGYYGKGWSALDDIIYGYRHLEESKNLTKVFNALKESYETLGYHLWRPDDQYNKKSAPKEININKYIERIEQHIAGFYAAPTTEKKNYELEKK